MASDEGVFGSSGNGGLGQGGGFSSDGGAVSLSAASFSANKAMGGVGGVGGNGGTAGEFFGTAAQGGAGGNGGDGGAAVGGGFALTDGLMTLINSPLTDNEAVGGNGGNGGNGGPATGSNATVGSGGSGGSGGQGQGGDYAALNSIVVTHHDTRTNNISTDGTNGAPGS